MRLAVATLADAANVRDGLLNVLGAGLTTFYSAEFPARFNNVFVLVIEILPTDAAAVRREAIAVTVSFHEVANPTGELARVTGGMEPSGEEFSDSESTSSTPLVVPLNAVPFARPGPHYIIAKVGDIEARVHFDVTELRADDAAVATQ